MKIIIVPDYPRLTARRYEIAKSLVDSGHDVHFILWEFPYGMSITKLVKHICTSLLTNTYRHEGITVHKIARLPYFWPLVNGVLFKQQIKRIFQKHKIDFIFAESYTNETEIPADLPFIYDLADDYAAPAELYGSKFYKLAFKLLDVRGVMQRQCSNALAVTAVSRRLHKYASLRNKNVVYLYNGIDKNLIKKVKTDPKYICTNPHSIVYVSGFGPWSRSIETMQTVTKLKTTFPDIQLTMIGDGAQVNAIIDYIEINNADSYIQYLGYVSDRYEVLGRIRQAAIGLNISEKNKWRDAAHPMKVMEYSALGTKVVSTDLDEVMRLGYKNIFIFSEEPGEDLQTILERALNYKESEHEYDVIAKKVLTELDWDKLSLKLINLARKHLR